MRWIAVVFLLFRPHADAAPGENAAGAALGATEIVNRANKVLRGESSHVEMDMAIRTPKWSRILGIEAWTQGRERALIVIHAPPKDKGNTTLRRKNEMWVWMPSVERVMKIPPTMMHTSWQGSDFTYEDIVKADSIVKDYSHKIVERKSGSDFETLKIEAIPKPEAPVVWGKVFLWCDLYPDGQAVPVKEEDYNERGELMRAIELSRVTEIQGRRVPMRLECTPSRKPGQKTVIEYHRIDFDISLTDDFFSLGRLQNAAGPD